MRTNDSGLDFPFGTSANNNGMPYTLEEEGEDEEYKDSKYNEKGNK